jgi:Mut7-C RNAse domain
MSANGSLTMTQDLRFLCDEMLAGLGRWLRIAGYDTAIADCGRRDRDLVEQAHAEQRILLTRDRRLVEIRRANDRTRIRRHRCLRRGTRPASLPRLEPRSAQPLHPVQHTAGMGRSPAPRFPAAAHSRTRLQGTRLPPLRPPVLGWQPRPPHARASGIFRPRSNRSTSPLIVRRCGSSQTTRSARPTSARPKNSTSSGGSGGLRWRFEVDRVPFCYKAGNRVFTDGGGSRCE